MQAGQLSQNGSEVRGGCAEDVVCEACGIAKGDPTHQRMRWALLIANSRQGQTEFWRTAIMSDAFFAATSGGSRPEHGSLMTDVMRARAKVNSMFPELTGQHGVSAEASFVADFPQPPPLVAPSPNGTLYNSPMAPLGWSALSQSEEHFLGMNREDVFVPGQAPPADPGGGTSCCCKAEDIVVDGSTKADVSSYGSEVIVALNVGQGKGPAKGCSLEWEELPNYDYSPAINGKDVPPTVKKDVYTNLTEHKAFKAMAKSALSDLTEVCPVAIRDFTDRPRMTTGGRLVIRITLKSGCDATYVTVYVVLTAPTSIVGRLEQLTDPEVVGVGSPKFKELESEYKKSAKEKVQ